MVASSGQLVTAWRPAVEGIAEVLHARFTDHAYPLHTHDTWTLLIVDAGVIEFDLDRGHHDAVQRQVTLLPPGVPHDGRAATRQGFRKRVLYLDPATIGEEFVGAAVDAPSLRDPRLRQWIHRLHRALGSPGDEFAAQSRFTLIRQELVAHLRPGRADMAPAPALARRLRHLLDERTVEGISLAGAAEQLHAHPAYLLRSFTAAYGIAPHAYLTGRRIEASRRLLLAGVPAAQVAGTVGLYDQAHFTRHFRRYLATTPGRYAAAVTPTP